MPIYFYLQYIRTLSSYFVIIYKWLRNLNCRSYPVEIIIVCGGVCYCFCEKMTKVDNVLLISHFSTAFSNRYFFHCQTLLTCKNIVVELFETYWYFILHFPRTIHIMITLNRLFCLATSSPRFHFHVCLQTQETNALITAVLEVQPRLASGGSGKTSDEIVYDLADSILSKLPAALDMEKADKSMFEVRVWSVYPANERTKERNQGTTELRNNLKRRSKEQEKSRTN